MNNTIRNLMGRPSGIPHHVRVSHHPCRCRRGPIMRLQQQSHRRQHHAVETAKRHLMTIQKAAPVHQDAISPRGFHTIPMQSQKFNKTAASRNNNISTTTHQHHYYSTTQMSFSSATPSQNEKILSSLKPQLVFNLFAQLSNIPRQSMKEEPVREWLRDLCHKHPTGKSCKWHYLEDHVGNVLIKVPENDSSLAAMPTVVFQGHLDMVCEKDENHQHDFLKDPIQLQVVDEWLHAKGTTLGADCGIGVCIALAVAADPDVKHGPLEILLTIDEEEGMLGAESLKESATKGFKSLQTGKQESLEGRHLVNLDSEEDGVFCIGCAGALETVAQLTIDRQDSFPEGKSCYKLKVSGLLGGHSGVDIIKGLGNANKLLARTLYRMHEHESVDFDLSHVSGGRKRNAIPREASALVFLSDAEKQQVEEILKQVQQKSEFHSVDKDLQLTLHAAEAGDLKPFTRSSTQQLLKLFYAIPSGVIRMSPEIENFVETSTNFGVVSTGSNVVEIATMQRSSNWEALQELSKGVRMVCELAGCKVVVENPLTPWQPQPQSELLRVSKEAFKELRGEDAKVEAIHAGLECGLIIDAYPDIENCVSYGPTIRGAHSPSERLRIADVGSCYNLTVSILKKLYSSKQ